jgi:hypothetical protein
MNGFEIWTAQECTDYVNRAGYEISLRRFNDLARDPAVPVPPPFGKAGNARLWDPLQFKAGCDKLFAYFEAEPARAKASRELELKRREEAFERRVADFERDAALQREVYAMWESSRKIREQQEEERRQRLEESQDRVTRLVNQGVRK